jgi:hypothetical protein
MPGNQLGVKEGSIVGLHAARASDGCEEIEEGIGRAWTDGLWAVERGHRHDCLCYLANGLTPGSPGGMLHFLPRSAVKVEWETPAESPAQQATALSFLLASPQAERCKASARAAGTPRERMVPGVYGVVGCETSCTDLSCNPGG